MIMNESHEPRPQTVTEKALSALSGAPDIMKIEVEGDVGRCPKCTRPVGTVVGRNLLVGELILITRAKSRCRSCKTKLLWEPHLTP